MTRRQATVLLGLLAVANLLNYGVRNMPSTFYGDFETAFGATPEQFGLIVTAFIVPHAVATVLCGWLADRVERRRLLACGMLVWILGAILAAMAGSMGGFLLAWTIAGLGTGACVPVANALICDAYTPGRTARAVSVFNLGMFLGGVVGVSTGEHLGFPIGLWMLALPTLIVAGLVMIAPVPRVPHGAPLRGGPPPAPRPSASLSIRSPTAAVRGIVRDVRSLFALAPYRWSVVGSILMAFAAGAYAMWFVALLHLKGLEDAQVNTLYAVAGTGGLLGVISGGVAADRLRRSRVHGRQLVIATGFALAVPFALLSIELPAGVGFYASSALMMFFISWYHAPIVASVDEMAPTGREATAQGFYIFCMHLFGTAPSSFLVGVLVRHVGLVRALYLPTAAMVVAALLFVGAARSVRRAAAVLQREA